MSVPHGPLQGVKVVSCSTAQAGTVPWMLMADLGADVIKIESPQGGDPSRRMTVLPGMGSTFAFDLNFARGSELPQAAQEVLAANAYFSGSHVCHRWGGSTTWSSTLTRIRSSSCIVFPQCRERAGPPLLTWR